MFGAVAGLVGDMLFAGMDAQWLHDGVRQMRERPWGHAPYDDVITRSKLHNATAEAHKQQYASIAHRMQRLAPAEVAQLRDDVHDLLRENNHLATMVELKRQSVVKKHGGTVRRERLAKLTDVHDGLKTERERITKGLETFGKLYPSSKSETTMNRLKNANAALQRFAYRRPIVAGSAMAAVAIGIPLLMLYQTIMSAKRDASGLARG